MKENLELLAKRFDEMATVMRDNADGKRPYAYKREDIAMFNGAALAYRICANQGCRGRRYGDLAHQNSPAPAGLPDGVASVWLAGG